MTDYKRDSIKFYDLDWDTDFFGVKSAKLELINPISLETWNAISEKFKEYEFISIVNRNSEPVNTQIICENTNAFLADVNIQFSKKTQANNVNTIKIDIQNMVKENKEILNLVNFDYSKFTEDPELLKRGGDKLYLSWVKNSFNNKEKYFAVSYDENNEINGFLLHSFVDNACIIELIAVSNNAGRSGIGTKLFKYVENNAYKLGKEEIRVGTQVRNINAINFYHKVGCRQIGCHQVFHLWNL